MKISEQRELLDNLWEVIPLRGKSKAADKRNLKLIESFSCEGSSLEYYLKENAWEEDSSGAKKVYLVVTKKDKKKGQEQELVGYFALSAGLLFVPKLAQQQLTEHEETLVRGYINILIIEPDKNYDPISPIDHKTWSNLKNKYKRLARRIYGKERTTQLWAIAESRYNALKDRYVTKEANKSFLVEDSFPAIELTHICKNDNYVMPADMSLGFSSYVFWEHIYDIIQDVSSKVGAQYVYLFAAESNPEDPYNEMIHVESNLKEKKNKNKLNKAALLQLSKSLESNRLIRHYMKNLKFRLIEDVNILKPSYDDACFSMIQEISKLSENRKLFWSEHADPEELLEEAKI